MHATTTTTTTASWLDPLTSAIRVTQRRSRLRTSDDDSVASVDSGADDDGGDFAAAKPLPIAKAWPMGRRRVVSRWDA